MVLRVYNIWLTLLGNFERLILLLDMSLGSVVEGFLPIAYPEQFVPDWLYNVTVGSALFGSTLLVVFGFIVWKFVF